MIEPALYAGPNTPFLKICHSQGAVLVKNALMCYPKELRKRIIVVAIAPGAYIPKYLCKEVTLREQKRSHPLARFCWTAPKL